MGTLKTTITPTLQLIHHIAFSGNGGWRRALWKARQATLILTNIAGHRELAAILTRPGLVNFTRRYPKLLYKYLWNDYLVHGLHRNVRLAVLTNHYRLLEQRVKEDVLLQAYEGSHTLWQETRDGHAFRIALSFPRGHDYEGDLRVTFESNGIMLYWMLFTIVPGHVVGSSDEHVFLISAIQGASQKIDQLREAAKLCNDTAAAHLLLGALEALARSFNVSLIAGVGLAHQVQRQMSKTDVTFRFDYDAFWTAFNGEKAASGFYFMPLPFAQKPLDEVKPKHRSRAVRRRALKQQIAEQTQAHFRQLCKEPA